MCIEEINFVLTKFDITSFVDLVEYLGYKVDPNYDETINCIFAFDEKKNCFVQRKNLVKKYNWIETGCDYLLEEKVKTERLRKVCSFLCEITKQKPSDILDKLKKSNVSLYKYSNNWEFKYDNKKKCYVNINYSIWFDHYDVNYKDTRFGYEMYNQITHIKDEETAREFVYKFEKLMKNDQNRKSYE